MLVQIPNPVQPIGAGRRRGYPLTDRRLKSIFERGEDPRIVRYRFCWAQIRNPSSNFSQQNIHKERKRLLEKPPRRVFRTSPFRTQPKYCGPSRMSAFSWNLRATRCLRENFEQNGERQRFDEALWRKPEQTRLGPGCYGLFRCGNGYKPFLSTRNLFLVRQGDPQRDPLLMLNVLWDGHPFGTFGRGRRRGHGFRRLCCRRRRLRDESLG